MRLTWKTLLPAVTGVMLLQAGVASGQEAKWSMAKPLPQPLAEISGAVVDNKWYVMGGYDFGTGQPQGVVTVHDPVAGTWSLRKNMLFPAHHPAAVALDGKIYVFGGFVGHPGAKTWGPVANALVYDPAADSWKELTPMPTPRGSAQAVAVNGKIYVIGGSRTRIFRVGERRSHSGKTSLRS